MTDFETMLTNDVESTYEQCTDSTVETAFPHLESQLAVTHAKLITLKACKGTMCFLPLPLKKTLETLDQVQSPSDVKTSLPDPELLIIVNGKPTKSNTVWQTLGDVNAVRPPYTY